MLKHFVGAALVVLALAVPAYGQWDTRSQVPAGFKCLDSEIIGYGRDGKWRCVSDTPFERKLAEDMERTERVVDEVMKDHERWRKSCDRFLIAGRILDRDQISITVFGNATPYGHSNLSSEGNHAGAGRGTEVYLMVINPDLGRVINNAFYTGGSHCYLRKDYGTNQFGAKVPIWVYE